MNYDSDLINKLVDHRSAALWEELSTATTIEIVAEDRPDYMVNSRPDHYVIYVQKNLLDPSSFAHELLHVKLRQSKLFIASDIRVTFQTNSELQILFSNRELTDHISNCLEHLKMLPMFIDMGYDKKDFLMDYQVEKFTKDDFKLLRKIYRVEERGNKYRIKAIDFFMGKYFGLKACPNDSFDYAKITRRLKELDEELVNAMDKFIDQWMTTIDLTNMSDTQPLVSCFETDLELWSAGKKFVD